MKKKLNPLRKEDAKVRVVPNIESLTKVKYNVTIVKIMVTLQMSIGTRRKEERKFKTKMKKPI